MKNQTYLSIALLVILMSITACTKTDRQPIVLAGYDFPLNVDQVVKKLGLPNDTSIDSFEDSSCPVGQLHSWDIKDKNYTLSVLGDDYEKKVNYAARSRLIGINKIDRAAASKFEGFLGIHLDDSIDDVKRKLDAFVIKNPTFHLAQYNEGFFLCHPSRCKFQYVLESDKDYLYFEINNDNKLESIIKATFKFIHVC